MAAGPGKSNVSDPMLPPNEVALNEKNWLATFPLGMLAVVSKPPLVSKMFTDDAAPLARSAA